MLATKYPNLKTLEIIQRNRNSRNSRYNWIRNYSNGRICYNSKCRFKCMWNM